MAEGHAIVLIFVNILKNVTMCTNCITRCSVCLAGHGVPSFRFFVLIVSLIQDCITRSQMICTPRVGDKIEKNEKGWACGAYG